jgi:frataxin
MPDTENPSKVSEEPEQRWTAIELSENEYHEIADDFLDRVLAKCEEAQEEREDLDIEYSVRSIPSLSSFSLIPLWLQSADG